MAERKCRGMTSLDVELKSGSTVIDCKEGKESCGCFSTLIRYTRYLAAKVRFIPNSLTTKESVCATCSICKGQINHDALSPRMLKASQCSSTLTWVLYNNRKLHLPADFGMAEGDTRCGEAYLNLGTIDGSIKTTFAL